MTPALVAEHGLNQEEYGRIHAMLGRAPTFTELGIFSALWSEHCAYKHSRPLLRQFPTGGPRVLQGPGENAGVLRLLDGWAVAFKIESHNHPSAVEPYQGAATGGGKAAVAEAARNVAVTGAQPVGITNCLNFGSPERPEVFYQFRETCRGMAEACRALETPVTGGNVSFYNESPSGAADPTPVVGMVGLLDDATRASRAWFTQPGHRIILLGTTRGHLGGSAYWAQVLGVVGGSPPPVDLPAERRLVSLLVALSRGRLIASAHDLSDGGLAVALAESCFGPPYAERALGAEVDLRGMLGGLSSAAVLFGEDQARALLSASPDREAAVLALAREHDVPAAVIGTVGAPGGRLRVTLRDAELSWPVDQLRSTYDSAIPRRMGTFQVQEAAD